MARTKWAVDGCEWILAELLTLAEDGDLRDADTVRQYREAVSDDLPDMAADIAEVVQDWIYHGNLSHDGGGPCIDEPAFAADIREAVKAALAKHADMSEATWVPTGHLMTVGEARAMLWPNGDKG